jgi:hypothetical protein
MTVKQTAYTTNLFNLTEHKLLPWSTKNSSEIQIILKFIETL